MRDFLFVIFYLKRRRKVVAVGVAMVVVTNLLNVFIPSFVGRAVDLLQSDFAFRLLLRLCAIILGIELVKGLTRFFMRYILIGASWHVENDIRTDIYRHLLKLPLDFYHRTRTGDIVSRLTNDLTAVRMLVGPAVMYSINALVFVPAALAFMLSIDAELTLYALIPFPFIAFTINRLGRKIHTYFTSVQEAYSDISAHVQEDLAGVGVVKSYCRESSEMDMLRSLSGEYVENNRKVIRLQSIMRPTLDIVASAGIAIVLWTGAHKVAAGETSLGSLVSLIMYLGLMVWPAISLGWIVAIFQRGTVSARRIREILDEEPERGETAIPGDRLGGGIRVDGLTFTYPDGEPVLRDISFEISPGEMTAVVGRTGSGKTTLMNVLTGTFSVPRGTVYFDGRDINDIPLPVLRASIALVPQDTFLFSETVRENIAFGRENADFATVRKAAEMAAIASEIDDYPDGFETVLGERGITVSGGQRQRLAIARAFVSDAPMFFFDDCLSNVDIDTEMMILRRLRDIVRGKTALVVTQRLGAVKDADLILYFDNGRIRERGTHGELMKQNGEYATLFREQETLNTLGDA